MTEEEISALLQKRRQMLGLTIDDLAAKTGIPKPHLLALESQQFRFLPEERLQAFLETYARVLDLDGLTYQPEPPKSSSRLARKHPERQNKLSSQSYLPMFYLTLVALSILLVVAYVVHQYGSQLEEARAKYALRLSEAVQTSASSMAAPVPASSSEPEPVPKSSLTVTGGGDQLSVTLANPSPTVSLTVTLDAAQAERSWLGVTSSDLPPEGRELTLTHPQQVVTLSPETTSTTITLGVTKGISLTIDGQALDLSTLTTDGLSTITLTISP